MSCYVCNNKVISIIALAFAEWGDYKANNYDPSVAYIGGFSGFVDLNSQIQAIGQSLLDNNYKSVNYRYNEDTPTPRFIYDDSVNLTDLGLVMGSIDEYDYQTCELPYYYLSDLYDSLVNLKSIIGKKAINRLGYEIRWYSECTAKD